MKDAIAAVLSCLCIVHCLALPVGAAWLPSLVSVAENDLVHQILLAVAMCLSGPLLFWKGNNNTRFLGLVGFLALIIGLSVHHELAEKVVTSIGSCFIAVGHIVRHQACKCCKPAVDLVT